MGKHARFVRAVASTLRRGAAAFGICLGLVVGVVALALISIDIGPVRRFIVQRANDALASTFAGTVVIESLEHLRPNGIEGADVRVRGPDGATLLIAQDVDVRLAPIATLRSWLCGGGAFVIHLDGVTVPYLDANVALDERGRLRLTDALRTRSPAARDNEGRVNAVRFGRLRIAHSWIHGRPEGLPPIDADVDHVEAEGFVGPERTLVQLQGMEVTTRGAPYGANLHIHLAGRYAEPAENGKKAEGNVAIGGKVGPIPVQLSASFAGAQLSASVDVPRITEDMLRELSVGVSGMQPISLHVDAKGDLADLAVDARLASGESSLHIDGHVMASPSMRFEATFEANDIDLQRFARDLPETHLDARLKLRGEARENEPWHIDYLVDLDAGSVSGRPTPPAHVEGNARLPGEQPDTAAVVTGAGRIDEPGAPTQLQFEALLGSDRGNVEVHARTSVASIEGTRLGLDVRGTLAIQAHARIAFGHSPEMGIDVEIDAADIARGDLHIDRATIEGQLSGPITDPQIRASLSANGLRAAGIEIDTAAATLKGTVDEQMLTASLSSEGELEIDGRAILDPGEVTLVRDFRVVLSRNDARAVVRARALRIGDEVIQADGVVVQGLGKPVRLQGRRTSQEARVRVSAPLVEIEKIARIWPGSVATGNLSLDLDLMATERAVRGHLDARIDSAMLKGIPRLDAALRAVFEGRTVTASGHLEAGALGTLELEQAHVVVDGRGPLALSSWRQARGELDLGATVHLDVARSMLPAQALPFGDMSGVVELAARVARAKSGNQVPVVNLALMARDVGLGVGRSNRHDDEKVADTVQRRLDGIDAELRANIDDAGATSILVRLADKAGSLASVDVRSPSVPYGEWLRGKAVDVGELRATPVEAHLLVPTRDVAHLPSAVRTVWTKGNLAAQASVYGSLDDPRVQIEIDAAQLQSPLDILPPVGVRLAAAYDNRAATVGVAVGAEKRRPFLHGWAEVKGELSDWIGLGARPKPDWDASIQMRLDEFPLELVDELAIFGLRGRANGELSVRNLHRDARAIAAVSLRNMVIGDVPFPSGNIDVNCDGQRLRAALRLDQKDGFAVGRADLAVAWGDRLIPTVLEKATNVAELRARSFDASALVPFVHETLNRLDGRIDADARIRLGSPSAPAIAGFFALHEGRLQVAPIGQIFHQVDLRVEATEDGRVRIEHASLLGPAGQMSMTGEGRLRGWGLEWAQASIWIPHEEPMPLNVAGIDLGDVDGLVQIEASAPEQSRLSRVSVAVPRLHVSLPRDIPGTTQSLDEPEHIRTGYFRSPRRFINLPMEAEDLREEETSAAGQLPSTSTETEIAVHLGNEVEVRRGTTFMVVLAGATVLTLDGEPQMTGQIRLLRGFLVVRGRRFEIEQGTVTFTGEPSNPQLVLTAGWTAPDGTRVYADYLGPLQGGEVTLRSDPPRPKNEILALILFGVVEGSATTPYATPQPSGAVVAGTFAAGLATEGLTKAVDRLTGLRVAARVDTTVATHPKPEIEIQIARDLSVELGYVLRTPTPFMNPDRTFITIDWRFLRRWSMEATFGDQGTSILDWVWQYRY